MQLERYGHGGDLRTAEDAYGIPADEWLDFSSNMNPWGPPEAVGDLLRDRWRDIVRYPDPAVRKLRAKLSSVYDVPMDSILVGNGAAELIELAVRLLRPATTLLARPSFSEYEEAVRKIGGYIAEWPLHAEDDFRVPDLRHWARHGAVDADAWTGQAVNDGDPNHPAGRDCASDDSNRPTGRDRERSLQIDRTIFLGHPNNPTGRLVPDEALRGLVQSGAQLIVDEAFMDFVPDEAGRSLLREAAASDRVVVIRSMTKFYAVPGIRLGFLVAHPDRVRRLAALQTQWSVNFFAQLIGEAVLDDHAYAARTREWLAGERPWLAGRLQALGLRVVPSDVNFLLVSLPEDGGWTALRLQQAMAAHGIMIRDASLFKGLDTSYFRVAIRLRHENERLIRALQEVLSR